MLAEREQCVGACIHTSSDEPSEDEADGLRQQLTDEQLCLRHAHDDYSQRVISCAADAMRRLQVRVEHTSRTARQLDFASRALERLRHRSHTWSQSTHLASHDVTVPSAFQCVNNSNTAAVTRRRRRSNARATTRSSRESVQVDMDLYNSIARDVKLYAQKILESLERLLKRFNRSVSRMIRRHFKPCAAALLCGVVCGSALYAAGHGDLRAAAGLTAAVTVCSFAAGRSVFAN